MTRAYGVACAPCRRLKSKCTFSSADPDRCDRCAAVGRQCVVNPRRRRATKYQERDAGTISTVYLQPSDRINPAKPAEDFSSKPLFSKYDLPSEPRKRSDNVNNKKGDYTKNASSIKPLGDITSAVATFLDPMKSNDSPGFTPDAFVSYAEDARTLSLDAALDPENLGGKLDSERSRPSRESSDMFDQNDPIHLGLLNLLSAQHLYEGYFTHFGYHVGFLDPILYSFDYTRHKSSFLFTVLISISARVFRPDLARILRSHAEILLGNVLLSCEAQIENVWAIVSMYYWKELSDKRGYTLTGFAMRLAAGSEWHGGRRCAYTGYDNTTLQRNVKLTENDARRLRDQDRAWLYLSALERTVCLFTGRPLTGIAVAPDLGSRDWLRTSSPCTYPFGDARALAGHELTDIIKPVYDCICSTRRLGKTASVDTFGLSNAIQKLDSNLAAWSEYWAPIFASHESSVKVLESQVYMYGNYIRTYFNSVLVHRVLESTGNCVTTDRAVNAIYSCYSATLGVLREAVTFGRGGVLYYLWDTAHLMIAYAAMVLLKLLKQAPSCPGVSIQETYGVLKEVADVYSSAARSLSANIGDLLDSACTAPAETTVAAQVRLLKSILFRINTNILPPGSEQQDSSGTPHSSEQPFNCLLLPTSCQKDTLNLSQLPLPSRVDEQAIEATQHLNTSTQWDEGQETVKLSDEMDLSLDASLVENWFTQAGLLPWNQPGMFTEPR